MVGSTIRKTYQSSSRNTVAEFKERVDLLIWRTTDLADDGEGGFTR